MEPRNPRQQADFQAAPEPVAHDPLGYGEPLPLVERFYPLGFPLVLRTNSSDVIVAGREGWQDFDPAFETPPIELRVAVRGDATEPARTSPEGPSFTAQGHLLAVVLAADNFAVCDLDSSFCFARLTPAVARNHVFTSFHFLDSMAYVSIAHRHATPIHASCVARNGDGILLAGEPGAGKSSLAWACAKAGLTYVSDDATWLLRDSAEPLLVGKHRRLRFRPDALELFPELRQAPRRATVIGKHSFEIRTADIEGLSTASCCRPSKLVFLDRRESGSGELVKLDEPEALARLRAVSPLWEPRVWEEQEASRERLARQGALLLRYSTIEQALDHILKL